MGESGRIGKQTRKKLCQFYPTGSNHLFGTFCGKLVSLQWFRPSMMILYAVFRCSTGVSQPQVCQSAAAFTDKAFPHNTPDSHVLSEASMHTLIDPYLSVLTHRRGYTCRWEHYRHCMGAMLSGNSETIRRLGGLDASIWSPRMQNYYNTLYDL